MKVKLDENNYVESFAIVGDIEGSIDTNIDISVFEDNPCCLYKFQNGELVLDEKKQEEYFKEIERQEKLEALSEKITNIGMWLSEYDEKYKEYERCQRFGLEFGEDIEKLNKQAKEQQLLLLDLKKEYETLK